MYCSSKSVLVRMRKVCVHSSDGLADYAFLRHNHVIDFNGAYIDECFSIMC